MDKPLFYGIDLSQLKGDEESEPVQYVGVYVLKWGETAQPSIGFIPVPDHILLREERIHNALLPFARAYRDALDVGEIWQGAFDRINEEMLMLALDAVVFPEDEDE